ncbi:hypothetical protein CSUI_007624, partial [Cystoisospora suis]
GTDLVVALRVLRSPFCVFVAGSSPRVAASERFIRTGHCCVGDFSTKCWFSSRRSADSDDNPFTPVTGHSFCLTIKKHQGSI